MHMHTIQESADHCLLVNVVRRIRRRVVSSRRLPMYAWRSCILLAAPVYLQLTPYTYIAASFISSVVSIPYGMFFFSRVTSPTLLVFLSYSARRRIDKHEKNKIRIRLHSTVYTLNGEQSNLKKMLFFFIANPFWFHTNITSMCAFWIRTRDLQPSVKWHEFIDKGGTNRSQQHYV